MPVTDVLRRLTGLCDVLDVHVTDDEPAGVDLLTDPGAFVDAEAARIETRYGVRVPRHVAASRALHDYAWSAALLMSGPWFLERRVPLVRPQDLRADLATASYQVRPAGDAGDDLLGALTAHLEPVLAAFAPLTRRGSRALWGMAGDDLVSGLWYLGRVLDREDDGIRAASELLPGPVGRFPAGAAFRNLTAPDGSCHPTRTRAGCCMFYAIRPTEACGTCPRTPDAERLRRIG
ncbi:(2Fe-2S)-binding protein [Streptomyces sp. NPDC004539]|uniref:(2Fe-2S)-binding protein n=1 Tax=Streptomyces sp. NPDC004539 TaxID=3154280 RepID=UPI0033ABB7C9